MNNKGDLAQPNSGTPGTSVTETNDSGTLAPTGETNSNGTLAPTGETNKQRNTCANGGEF
ncbi:hypothetical protein [Aridibaculum aurantiacum]|uniref:hypothetical protein n=1 Tax=Aridibaculum aurantiacum TaxID=2810307 RepID=UPI001A96684B|nr:hypothetical protein [Aridibaculum aurantiacum]